MVEHCEFLVNLQIVADEEEKDNIISLKSVPHFVEMNERNFSPDLVDSEIYDEELLKLILIGIAQNIAVEMDKQNYTIGSLSRITGISTSHISRILNSKQDIGLKTLLKIAKALHVNPSALFPVDGNSRKTNGQRFDDITKGIPLKYTNYYLDIIAGLCSLYRKDNQDTSLYSNAFNND